MARVKNILLGLDPGGIGNFGWCVADAGTNLPIKILATGKADHAQAAITAVQKALAYIPTLLKILAVGIDSPLFWTSDGDREADISVRSAIKAKGAKNVYGTVQNVNALRGACVVQGVLSARLLRCAYPKIRITESHPKALLQLLSVKAVEPIDLSEYLNFDTTPASEHERDAALGALAAWYMLNPDAIWHNLFDNERFPYAPIPQVEYWMPIIPHSKSHCLTKTRSGTVELGKFVQEFKKLHPEVLTENEEKAIEAIILDCENHYMIDNTKQMFVSKAEFYSWLYAEVSFHAKLSNLDFAKAEAAYIFWAKQYHSYEYDKLS